MNYEICVIGHVTQDQIIIDGEAPRVQPGGTAHYSGIALRSLGMETAVLTKVHPADRAGLLSELTDAGAAVLALPSPRTTRFVNTYPDAHSDTREQRVLGVASPFEPDDLTVEACVYLLGPLMKEEIGVDSVLRLARSGAQIGLDIQGLLRELDGDHVVWRPYDGLSDVLAHVYALKASEEEALFVTGEATPADAAAALASMGPSEVAVTSGSQGSVILARGTCHRIPAYPPVRTVDTTGCGDTYFAAYLARRLRGDSVARAGHIAAAVASAKISGHGPYRGGLTGVPDQLLCGAEYEADRQRAPQGPDSLMRYG